MSYFVQEPVFTNYKSDINPNILQTPDKYLQTIQYKFSPFANVDPWFQPNRDYNYYLMNNITPELFSSTILPRTYSGEISNKQYRKYMTDHNNEIIKYNTKLYQKQWFMSYD